MTTHYPSETVIAKHAAAIDKGIKFCWKHNETSSISALVAISRMLRDKDIPVQKRLEAAVLAREKIRRVMKRVAEADREDLPS